MEDFEHDLLVTTDGQAFVLRYWAMNYGTHVGSTLRLIEPQSGAKAIDLSFECHWNAPGRYILRQGSAVADPAFAFSAQAMEAMGIAAMRTFAGHFGPAASLGDVYGRVKTGAPDMLAQCAALLPG
ncbi:MAG: hypothetical protein FJX29_03575 [Alphaproteobacteria bacterium]|nr:hypothetical protein [Alphaproteobacteria bacterium]